MSQRGCGVVLLVVVASASAAAVAAPPRGRRPARPAATHVVVDDVELVAGRVRIELRAGAAVTVAGTLPRDGRVRVTTAGPVVVTGTVDATALGLRVQRDGELRRAPGAAGKVLEGAVVHPLGAPGADGWVRVRTGGLVHTDGEVRADTLAVTPRELVYRAPSQPRMVWAMRDVLLHEQPTSVGTNAPPVAALAAGGDAVLLGQDGALAHVRTYGAVEVEGWALGRDFTEESPGSSAQLLKPTHEVLTGADLHASPTTRAVLARLRGGTLVEVAAAGRAGDKVKVTTIGDAIAVGFVDERALRALVTGESPI